MTCEEKKPNHRRNFLLRSLPFALPISGMKLTFEDKAQAQGDSTALVPLFQQFMEHYQSFQASFKKVQGMVGSYVSAYENVKKSYEDATAQIQREKNKFNSFHNLNTTDRFLDAELPNLSGSVDSILKTYRSGVEPFDDDVKKIRAKYPKKSGEVMTPKEVKYHKSREAHSRHALGKSSATHLRERTKALKQEIGKFSHSEAHNEKSAAELFAKESAPLKLDTLQNIDETLLRLEALMIRMEDKFNDVETKPKIFDNKQWVNVLKAFRKGKGTLTEVEN